MEILALDVNTAVEKLNRSHVTCVKCNFLYPALLGWSEFVYVRHFHLPPSVVIVLLCEPVISKIQQQKALYVYLHM